MFQQLIEDLQNSLETDRSAATRKYWASYIIDNNLPLLELVPILNTDHPIPMRFTWIFGEILKTKPSSLFPIVSYCFENRNHWKFPGAKRSISKMLWLSGVPEEIEGLVLDELFNWVLDPKMEVSVKVYSIEVLYKLTVKYPELKEELSIVLEDQLPKNSVGFKPRAKKILKKLSKINL